MTLKNQNFEMWQGDKRDIVFAVTLPSGSVLTGASSVWVLSPDSTSASIVRKTNNDDVTIASSTITVALAASDSTNLKGRYYHELQISSSWFGTLTAAIGDVTINPTVL